MGTRPVFTRDEPLRIQHYLQHTDFNTTRGCAVVAATCTNARRGTTGSSRRKGPPRLRPPRRTPSPQTPHSPQTSPVFLQRAGIGPASLEKNWWSRRELNPRPQGFQCAFVHVRSLITQEAGFVDSATTYLAVFLGDATSSSLVSPSPVIDTFGVLGRPSPQMLTTLYSGSKSKRVVVRN